MPSVSEIRSLRSARYVLIGTLTLAGIALVPYLVFYAPVIYEDDWSSTVWAAVSNNLHWLDWSAGRPLQLAPRLLLYKVFGLNLHAFYFVLFALNILAASQIFLLGRQMAPGMGLFAWAVAALFLVYPADYTRTYLTMISIRLSLCLLLFYAFLTLYFVRGRTAWLLALALISLILALATYEGGFGLVLAWCLLLLVIERSPRKWIVFLSTGVFGLLFALWRMVMAPRLSMGAQYLEEFSISPDLLIRRWWLGLKVLVWAWTDPVNKALHLNSTFEAALVVAGTVIGACGLAVLLGRVRSHVDDSPEPVLSRGKALRCAAAVFGAGVLLAITGYFPIITVFLPSLGGTGSRVNLFAGVGAAVMVAAILWAGVHVITAKRAQSRQLMIAGMIPLLLTGMAVQALVQREIKTAWEEQQDIWRDLFVLCPNLERGTAVYVVLPGYRDRFGYSTWHRTPLSAEWEVTAALRVLYADDSLRGDVIFPDFDRGYGTPELTQKGLVSYWSKQITPFEQAVFVVYNRASADLRLLKGIKDIFRLDWDPAGYAPEKLCRNGPAPEVDLRRLVGEVSLK